MNGMNDAVFFYSFVRTKLTAKKKRPGFDFETQKKKKMPILKTEQANMSSK